MHPGNLSSTALWNSSGDIQLPSCPLAPPARRGTVSRFEGVTITVLLSTRATSLGSVRASQQFSYLGSFRIRPCSSSRASVAAFSASVPSQIWMPSGWHRWALRSTKSRTPAGSWLISPLSTCRVWMLRHGDQHQGLSPCQLSLSESKQRGNHPVAITGDKYWQGAESHASGEY